MKIEVKDNNIEQALRVLKRKLQRDGFFKVVKLKSVYEKPSEKKKRILQENIKRVKKLKSVYEKPSEKKKRILQENIKRVKKLNKLKNRI